MDLDHNNKNNKNKNKKRSVKCNKRKRPLQFYSKRWEKMTDLWDKAIIKLERWILAKIIIIKYFSAFWQIVITISEKKCTPAILLLNMFYKRAESFFSAQRLFLFVWLKVVFVPFVVIKVLKCNVLPVNFVIKVYSQII